MRKLLFVLLQIGFLLSIQSHVVAGDGFRRPFKEGDYFEYIFTDYPLDTFRYSGKVIHDTLINENYISTLQIYNEPPLGDYTITYTFDTTTLNLSGGTYGCLTPNGSHLTIGFNMPIDYIWNTCSDTTGGAYFRSRITDTTTIDFILGSGIPLKTIYRLDTIGSSIEGTTEYIFSERFGFLYFYRGYGSPFGPHPYSKHLVGAIIDGVSYGSVVLGIEQISSQIPERFSLSQNFPNPFNPSTRIQFAIPKSGSVRLRVYDQLGREVRVLVNEELAAGSYEYEFDGSGLASGVYFYRIETGSFVETKKMLLIK